MSVLRWAASVETLDQTRISPRIIRSGGGSSLFVSGVFFEFICRLGRWASLRYHDSLRLGDVLSESLSANDLITQGLRPT